MEPQLATANGTAASIFTPPLVRANFKPSNYQNTKYPAVWVEITPEAARRYRDITIKAAEDGTILQRNVNKKHVEKLVREIRAGRWTDNADAMSFTSDGIILNGNHRLEAIAQSGCTVSSLAIFDAPMVIRENADKQLARTTAQQLNMLHKVEESRPKVGVINCLLLMKHGNENTRPILSDGEYLAKINEPLFVKAFNALMQIRGETDITKKSDRTRLRSVIALSVFVLAYPTNPLLVEKLYIQFLNGLGFVNQNEAIKKLREHVLDGDMSSGSGRPLIMRRGVYVLDKIINQNNNFVQNMPSALGKDFLERYDRSVSFFLAKFNNIV